MTSSTFAQDGVGGLRGTGTSTPAPPTRPGRRWRSAWRRSRAVSRGFAFASGLAAEDTLIRSIAKPGAHLVLPHDAYGGSFRLFARAYEPWGLHTDPVDLTDLAAVEAAIQPG